MAHRRRKHRKIEWFPSPQSRSNRVGAILFGVSFVLGLVFLLLHSS